MDLFQSAATETPWEWARARRRWFTSAFKDAEAGVVTAVVTGMVSHFAGERDWLHAALIGVGAGLLAGFIPPQVETLIWYSRRNRVLLEEENRRLREEREQVPERQSIDQSQSPVDVDNERRDVDNQRRDVDKQRRDLITSWRTMVAKAHQRLWEDRTNIPAVHILEQYEEFQQLRPYLSTDTKSELYSVGFGVHLNLQMVLAGTHPHLQKVSEDIDRIEKEWGLNDVDRIEQEWA
jgi:hypothetical protein